MKRFQSTLTLLLALLPLLAACSGDASVDPMPTDLDESYRDPEIQAQNLFVKGAARSGVANGLDEHSPFIIFSMTDEDFRAYLAEQGVSEEEFLASPDLRVFYEMHVLGDVPGLYEEITVEGAVEQAETLAGETVVIENRAGTLYIADREVGQSVLNENNTNYDFVLAERPVTDFPLR